MLSESRFVNRFYLRKFDVLLGYSHDNNKSERQSRFTSWVPKGLNEFQNVKHLLPQLWVCVLRNGIPDTRIREKIIDTLTPRVPVISKTRPISRYVSPNVRNNLWSYPSAHLLIPIVKLDSTDSGPNPVLTTPVSFFDTL